MIKPFTINPLTLPSVNLLFLPLVFFVEECLGWAASTHLSVTSKFYVVIDSEKISLN
jgi:hypothetical protein